MAGVGVLLSAYLFVPPKTTLVRRVIDGDTIELFDGRRVRYIGVDTPELRRRVHRRWVNDPQPMAREAAEANRELVQGRLVRLEYDAQTRDRYGRLLAYVYVDEVMVNERLLADGFGRLLIIPPDVRYADRFRQVVTEAKQAKRGVWRDELRMSEK